MKRKLAAFFAKKKKGRITSSDIFTIFKYINKHDNVIFHVGDSAISIYHGCIQVSNDEQQYADIIAYRADIPRMSSEKAAYLDRVLGTWVENLYELYLKGLNIPVPGIIDISDYKPVTEKYIKKQLTEYGEDERANTVALSECPLTDGMVEADTRVLNKDNIVCCYNDDTEHTCQHLYGTTTPDTGEVVDLECVLLTGNVYKDEL